MFRRRLILFACTLCGIVGCGSNRDAEIARLKAEAETAKAQADAERAKYELELEKMKSASRAKKQVSASKAIVDNSEARRIAERDIIDIESQIEKLETAAAKLSQLEQRAEQLTKEANRLPNGAKKSVLIVEAVGVAAERTALMQEYRDIPRQRQMLKDRLADARKRAVP